MPRLNPKTCFISAPFGADVSVLQDVLMQNGIDWRWAEDFKIEAGELLQEKLLDIISGCDLFVLVLESDFSPSQYFELGYAVGRRRPVFVLNSTGSRRLRLPVELRRFGQVEAELSDKRAIDYHLRAFLKSLKKDGGRRSIQKSGLWKQDLPYSDTAADDLQAMRAEDFSSAYERHVFELLSLVGDDLDIASVAQRRDMKPDNYALDGILWLKGPGFPEAVPALLEIKGAWSQISEDKSTELALNSMDRLQMNFGIVVFRGNRQLDCTGREGFFLFRVGDEMLERIIYEGTFYQQLSNARNRAAHGIA